MQPLVGVIMGSKSDWETMRHAAETLEKLGVPFEVAHRVGPSHAGPALRVRRPAEAARPGGDHRRRRRGRSSCRA